MTENALGLQVLEILSLVLDALLVQDVMVGSYYWGLQVTTNRARFELREVVAAEVGR